MAAQAKAAIKVLPVDLGRVFPVSGGLPLAKRAPQRQAYRLVELKRFSDFLGLPMNLQPRYFPVHGDDAAKLIIAVDEVPACKNADDHVIETPLRHSPVEYGNGEVWSEITLAISELSVARHCHVQSGEDCGDT